MSRLQAEDRRTARVALAAGLVFILAVSLGRCGSREEGHAAAQGRRARPQTPEETLAAICVHEAGWDHPGDCAAIYAVLANNATIEGVTWQRFLSWYSPRFTAGTGRNPWTLALRDSDAYPDGLGASWSHPRDGGLPSRREAYGHLVALAASVIRSPPVCEATDWGEASDYVTGRYARAHRFDVFPDCGEGLLLVYSADPDVD